MRDRLKTRDYRPETKRWKKSLVAGLWSLVYFTMIFKDVTRYEDLQRVQITLKQTKKVDSFIMKNAKRGLFEYEGTFAGSSKELIDILDMAVGGSLALEPTIEGDRLTIVITPKTP